MNNEELKKLRNERRNYLKDYIHHQEFIDGKSYRIRHIFGYDYDYNFIYIPCINNLFDKFEYKEGYTNLDNNTVIAYNNHKGLEYVIEYINTYLSNYYVLISFNNQVIALKNKHSVPVKLQPIQKPLFKEFYNVDRLKEIVAQNAPNDEYERTNKLDNMTNKEVLDGLS